MPAMVTILDTKGKSLLNEEISMGQLNVKNLAKGIYFVRIDLGYRSIIKEFIKQ